MKYYKKHWDETTCVDLTDSWGTSTYYFEVDEQNYPVRQIVLYENGNGLKYDSEHLDDDYGGLGDQALEMDEFESSEIDKSEFESLWTKIKWS